MAPIIGRCEPLLGLVDEHKRERDQRIDRPCQATVDIKCRDCPDSDLFVQAEPKNAGRTRHTPHMPVLSGRGLFEVFLIPAAESDATIRVVDERRTPAAPPSRVERMPPNASPIIPTQGATQKQKWPKPCSGYLMAVY